MYSLYIWKNTPVSSHGYLWLTSRKWIVAKWKKNRIAFEIWTAIPRVEKYKIGAAVQILEIIRLFFYERSIKYAKIRLREVSHQYPWMVTGVFFHMLPCDIMVLHIMVLHCSVLRYLKSKYKDVEVATNITNRFNRSVDSTGPTRIIALSLSVYLFNYLCIFIYILPSLFLRLPHLYLFL